LLAVLKYRTIAIAITPALDDISLGTLAALSAIARRAILRNFQAAACVVHDTIPSIAVKSANTISNVITNCRRCAIFATRTAQGSFPVSCHDIESLVPAVMPVTALAGSRTVSLARTPEVTVTFAMAIVAIIVIAVVIDVNIYTRPSIVVMIVIMVSEVGMPIVTMVIDVKMIGEPAHLINRRYSPEMRTEK
jgi:uncharacterized protein (DUF983 family)